MRYDLLQIGGLQRPSLQCPGGIRQVGKVADWAVRHGRHEVTVGRVQTTAGPGSGAAGLAVQQLLGVAVGAFILWGEG